MWLYPEHGMRFVDYSYKMLRIAHFTNRELCEYCSIGAKLINKITRPRLTTKLISEYPGRKMGGIYWKSVAYYSNTFKQGLRRVLI